MGGSARAGKRIAEMGFNAGVGVVNWIPGHMAAATRYPRRLKLADLVIEVRDARIPLSSANQDLQGALASKRRIIALNMKDLANPNIMHKHVVFLFCSIGFIISIRANKIVFQSMHTTEVLLVRYYGT
ncbi:short integuments 2, mitochondrial-like isoform X2 [Typha latifolia]|uniref:short integuments 2, mitochondrial-like isoform X2 n=1 Tax=Typha latifolia TaxID=4733 RepID=UPI003C2CC6C4